MQKVLLIGNLIFSAKFNTLWKKGAGFIAVLFYLSIVNLALATFTIYDVTPSTINSSEDIITITASASGLQNTSQYIQATLTKEGESSSNYFGFTKNLSGEWYKYKSSPATSDLSSYFYSFFPIGGIWTGQILAKLDIDDSGFRGPGNYILKLFKYITSSPSYSDTFTIVVNVTPTPTPTPTKTPTPVPTQIPTSTIDPTTSTPPESAASNSVLGENTGLDFSPPSSLTSNQTKKPDNIFQWISIVLGIVFIAACAILTFRIIKKGEQIQNEEE